MFPNEKLKTLFFWTIELLALSLLIYFISGFEFITRPISVFISTVFIPLIVAGFLYYVLKPLLTLVEKIKLFGKPMPHQLAVIITFLLFLSVIIGAVIALVPTLVREVTNLVEVLPDFAQDMQKFTSEAMDSRWFKDLNLSVNAAQVKAAVGDYAASLLTITAGTLGTIVTTVTTVTINVFTIPFVLFYMLNDSGRMVPAIKRMFPERHDEKISDLTAKMDHTIEKYISGQVIEMAFVGLSMTIGYTIIGQPYAWLLGVMAGITNIVPYLGPWIGVIPSLIVASTHSWKQVLLVLVVMTIVQQLDGNFIYPNVIGRSLAIHPLTIMLLLMFAGNLWGIVGMILIVPVYAVLRVVIRFAFDLYVLTRQQQ